jgi:hypothetical protein
MIRIAKTLGILIALTSAPAHGQWFATELDGGDATGVAAGDIVGRTAGFNALLWTDPMTPTPLHPPAATLSAAFGVHDGQQVGRALVGGANHAALWEGSPGSWVDLHPGGAITSIANAVFAGQQAGYAVLAGVQHAGVWSGTPESWVDMNPLGATRSFAEGVRDGRQVGSAMFGGIYHAGIWSGSALSWIDIHPANATESVAYDLDNGTPTGFIRLGNKHACIWLGVTSGYVDMNPPGATESVAYGISGGSQAGFAVVDDITTACVWQGSAATHRDLHPFVDSRFNESAASDIYKDFESGFTYVVGRAWNAGEAKAMLWTLPPHEIEPSSLTILRGSNAIGNLASIRGSDNIRLNVNPGVVLSNSQSPVILEISGNSPNPVIAHLKMSIEASANTSNAQGQIELFDYLQNQYETLSTFLSTTFDTTYEFIPPNPARYVSPSGEIKCRISYRLVGPILSFPWTSRLDWVHWRVVE